MSTPDPEIWEPSDEWIASLVRHLRGWPRGEYVALGLIGEWRVLLRAEALRVGRARMAGRDPYPPRSRRDGGDVSARDVILDLLTSPEGRLMIDLVMAMPAILAGAAAGAALFAVKALRPAVRHEVAPTYAYIIGKVGGTPWGPFWGSRGKYVVGPDGKGRKLPSPNDVGCRALHRAGINAATPARVRAWRDWLARLAPGELEIIWSELDEAGAAAVLAADPLPIWAPEPGPPRGLLPDPPSPVDDAAPSKVGSAQNQPTFVAGRGVS